MGKETLSIKEIVDRFDISYSTLNYYTNIGLLTVKDREKNARLYDKNEIKERLEKIAELRSKGYPLHLIQLELKGRK